VVIAVTQKASNCSRRLLESIGMNLIDSFVEFEAAQVMYSVARIPSLHPRSGKPPWGAVQ
jgi:hypothetical protein